MCQTIIQAADPRGITANTRIIQNDAAHARPNSAGGRKDATMAATDNHRTRSFIGQLGDRVGKHNSVRPIHRHCSFPPSDPAILARLTIFTYRPYREPCKSACQCGEGKGEMNHQRNLDRDRFLALHRQMLRIRALEETALRGLKDGLVLGAIHPSIGQEAIAAGVAGQLRRDDILLSTHRGHGHTLAKGADPEAMMRELFGRQGGNCGGKGGSMHIADFSVGMLGANGVVGANIIIGTGAAHAISLHGDDRVVACFFGDGATNRGPFLEGLNWAAVFDLPVLFICEDNGFAATTRTEDLTAGPGPAARAAAFGIQSETIDGNDITAVVEAAERIIAEVRATRRPAFLHAKTYRLTGHTGADPATYRTAEEVAQAWTNDPISRSEALLAASGVSAETFGDMASAVAAEMEQVFQSARAAPWPEVGDALTDVLDARQTGAEASA